MDWKVLYVKPRSEKKVVSLLTNLGITACCPMITEVHQWSDRKKKVEVPLLKSYVFVQVDDALRDMVFQVPHVVRYLFWLGKPALVKNAEILLMQKWLGYNDVQADVEQIAHGDRVNIATGPFKGEKGIVKEINKNRIQLLLLDLEIKITLNRNNN